MGLSDEAHCAACGTSLTTASVALAAPDEDKLGKRIGYPIGNAGNWFYDEAVRVEIIAASGVVAARAAQRATSRIPIVFVAGRRTLHSGYADTSQETEGKSCERCSPRNERNVQKDLG